MASNDAHLHARHRRYFLQDIPLEEALTRWFGALENAGALNPTDAEPVALDDPHIVGRITGWAGLGRRIIPSLRCRRNGRDRRAGFRYHRRN